MEDKGLGQAFSFVDETQQSRLMPRTAKRRHAWLPWVSAFLFCGTATAGVFAYLVSKGIILPPSQQPVAKLEQPPIKPPATKVVRKPQVPVRQAVKPTQVAVVEPVETENPPEPTKVATPVKSPQEILDEKGLKGDGGLVRLAAKEDAAYASYKKNKGQFEELRGLDSHLVEIDARLAMVKSLQAVQAAKNFDNADLNLALSTIPKRCGPREMYLNSQQLQAHYQVLNNAQDINQVGRWIFTIRTELDVLGNRDKLQVRFDRLLEDCRKSLAEAENEMKPILGEYKRLDNDEVVRAALAQAHRHVGPSDAFMLAVRYLSNERSVILPPNNRR